MNNIEILGINFDQKDIYNVGLEIRRKVFVEEQKVDSLLEYANEEESKHYVLFENGVGVACARYRNTDKGIKLERFAVLKEKRGLNFGGLIVEKVLMDLKNTNETVYLHAQIQVVEFYKKYGFKAIGKPFFEAGIEHRLMKLQRKNL